MKTILITGASSGIGRQLALDYAAADYKVIACARNSKALDELSSHSPEKIRALQVDVANKDHVAKKFLTITKIDKVILNAGTCEYIDVNNFDSALFERIFQVNVLGVTYCLESLLHKVNSGGQIAIVGSLARLLPFTRSAAYGSSKAAVHYLTKSLAVDLHNKDISVHTISPGFVKTPLTDKNDFTMPFLISVEEASKRIIKGLESGKADISFPRRLSWLLGLSALLPESLQHKISIKLEAN